MKNASEGLDKLYLDGRFLAPSAGMEAVINPADEKIIGQAPVASLEDLRIAIGAARHAFDEGPWPRLSAAKRAEIMTRFYRSLIARRDRFGSLIMQEGGAVSNDALSRQFDIPLQHLLHTIGLGLKNFIRPLSPVVTDLGVVKGIGMGVVERVPVGVVAAISPFNYPTYLNLAKIGPALMAGNTLVLKPSPLTPFQALLLGEAARDAEIPPGVLNIITGGVEVGKALTAAPEVDLLTFTGSDSVGSKIASQCASTLKRVLLELGGKSPLIVRADADLDMAAKIALRGFTAHAGQGCAMFTRAIVDNEVRHLFVEKVLTQSKLIKVGSPSDPSTTMGPLISSSQRDVVERSVQAALESGSNLVMGGGRPVHLNKGFYFEPTLFDNVDNRSPLAQDEIFGPVGCVIGFDTDEEAIRLSNDSKYGLRAGVMSSNVGHAFEMAQQLRAGQVLINGGALTALSDAPFGGFKRSGYGRENGEEGFLSYTEARVIEYHAG